jgi:hypothetical protein
MTKRLKPAQTYLFAAFPIAAAWHTDWDGRCMLSAGLYVEIEIPIKTGATPSDEAR